MYFHLQNNYNVYYYYVVVIVKPDLLIEYYFPYTLVSIVGYYVD